ncbi:hypothetical protein CRENBAI_013114 [Crenichthys baileyi]|uniref:Uncharacterized protein n=1 Tax=Crenichthys baileyi TaxID=28760 RepID=A0AAV9QVH9_9TELE
MATLGFRINQLTGLSAIHPAQKEGTGEAAPKSRRHRATRRSPSLPDPATTPSPAAHAKCEKARGRDAISSPHGTQPAQHTSGSHRPPDWGPPLRDIARAQTQTTPHQSWQHPVGSLHGIVRDPEAIPTVPIEPSQALWWDQGDHTVTPEHSHPFVMFVWRIPDAHKSPNKKNNPNWGGAGGWSWEEGQKKKNQTPAGKKGGGGPWPGGKETGKARVWGGRPGKVVPEQAQSSDRGTGECLANPSEAESRAWRKPSEAEAEPGEPLRGKQSRGAWRTLRGKKGQSLAKNPQKAKKQGPGKTFQKRLKKGGKTVKPQRPNPAPGRTLISGFWQQQQLPGVLGGAGEPKASEGPPVAVRRSRGVGGGTPSVGVAQGAGGRGGPPVACAGAEGVPETLSGVRGKPGVAETLKFKEKRGEKGGPDRPPFNENPRGWGVVGGGLRLA